MGYDFKADWELTKQNMMQLEQKRHYNASCQKWNREMTDLVNAYKQEEMAWYNSPQITENGFQTTTQSLWYMHYLNKKSLKSLGLSEKYDYIQPTEYVRGENQRFPHWSYSHDGKNLICAISDAMRYRRCIFAQNRLVWADEGNGLPGEYYIIQSRSMEGGYICPNCGNVDTLENFLDGCDYCQAKFQIDDFKQKVSSVYNPGSYTQQRSGSTVQKNFMLMFFILAAVVMGIPTVVASMGVIGALMMPVITFLAIGAFLTVAVMKTRKESVAGGPAKTKQTKMQIRNVDANFSEESFIGNLSNKLMSICYADSLEEIKPFVECDITSFMKEYKGVIDCKLLECVLMDYHTEGEYQYLDTKVSLELAMYKNGAVRKTKIQLLLELIKSIQAVTQSMNDVHIYQCESCGASLSLLNGGVCEYCGNSLQLKEYDWVIQRWVEMTAKQFDCL